MASEFSFSYATFSQRGVGKVHNEDALMLDGEVYQGTVREHGQVKSSLASYFAIADGVSISTRPRTASRRLLELLQIQLTCMDGAKSLSPFLHRLQEDFAGLASSPKFQGMASTLVGVRLVGNEATIFNTGDSRAYLLANGKVRLLSQDHSVLNDLLNDGEITLEQASNAASIYGGLSSQYTADAEFDDFKVHITRHLLLPGERLILCTDGLNEVLTDTQIADIFTLEPEGDLQKAFKTSRANGGTDDFSVIVLAEIS